MCMFVTSKSQHWIVFAIGAIKAPVFVRSSEVLQPAAVVDEANTPKAEQTQPSPPSSDVDTKLQDFLKVGFSILNFYVYAIMMLFPIFNVLPYEVHACHWFS